MRYGFRLQELLTIFDWLAAQITLRDKRWLNQNQPGFWRGKSIKNAIDAMRKSDTFYLRTVIESLLDAKRREKASYYRPVTTLAVQDLLQIVQMLKIEIPDKISGPELRDLIIGKIEASN